MDTLPTGNKFLIGFSDEKDELKEMVPDQSPDISLSSGPIEPLGTEKDSGSEPESSHNDVTPTHHYSLRTQQEWLKCHLKTATSEKNKLEEIAAQLLEKAERLQYELADAKEATKSRDEVIKLLQEQLARMETAYTKSLEESVQSRLQLTSHEQEILHLKEICYKYEEEKTKEVAETERENFEKLESRIKKLEGEKEKMREEIVLLESEKTSLVKRVKELTKSEVIDQCQRWKERCEKEVEETRDDSPGRAACQLENVSHREKQLEERNLYLEKKLLEMTEENAEMNSNFQRLVGRMESEKKISDSVSELKKKNFELEAYVKCLEREMEEKKITNFNEKEKEMQFLMKQFSRERESLIKIYKKKLNEKKSEDFHAEKWKRENESLKEMIKSLQNQISMMENKYSVNAKESLKSELFELKDQCDSVSKSVVELQAKDQQDLDYLVKENADLKKAISEIKSSLSKDDDYAINCKEKYMELTSENAKMKNVISDLESQVNSLTLLLSGGDRIMIDPNLKDSLEKKERQRLDEGSGRKGSHKKSVGTEDHLAWSNLYGIKSSEKLRGTRTSLSESSVRLWRVDGEEEGREIEAKEKNGVDSLVEMERSHSYDKLELLRLKREMAFLQSKMLDEKSLRKCLENQIEKISQDLREKQTLEQEVHSLKRIINRDYVQKSDFDLVQYNKELQEKREKYLDVATDACVDASNSDFKAKCEILAKEREKSKEIRSKIWSKPRSFHSRNRGSGSPVSQLGFSSTSQTEPDAFVSSQYGASRCLTLQPEIKNQLEKELEKSIRKYKSELSPTLSTSTIPMDFLK